MDFFKLFILSIFFLSFLTKNSNAGEFSPVIETGVNFHTGSLQGSMNGAKSYLMSLRAEKNKGFFHIQEAVEIEFGSGVAYLNSVTSSFTTFGGQYLLGAYFFPISNGKFLPFVGGNAILGWNQLKLTSPVVGDEPNTQGLIFGYELSAGVDIRNTSNMDSTALRIRTSYWSTSGALGGISGFQLQGVRISVGFVL